MLPTPSTQVGPRVRYEKRGRIAYVTLDRPAALNAMDVGMHEELAAVWSDFEADDEVWVAVLTGAGDRAFSVGQDLKELVARRRSGIPASTIGSRGAPGWPRLTERFDMTKPVVARVNGYALGGGFELALACDIIVAVEYATFALPEPKLGLVAGAGGLFRLSRQAPFKAAMGYALTGRSMSAERALELGLVNEVAPTDELDQRVDAWVDDILACAPLAVRAAKQVVTRSSHLSLEQAFATHYDAEERRRCSADADEGPRAFAEKRKPAWLGR